MNVTWLGQAGLLFENKKGTKIMVDPYLSDSLMRQRGDVCRRNYPPDEAFLKADIDVLIITHDHADHMDMDSITPLLSVEKSVLVLSPASVWQKLRTLCPAWHEYVMFDRGVEVTSEGIRFESVYAVHSDPKAIGALICDAGRRYYITGDTLYSKEIFKDVSGPIDIMFPCINGKGNNMNGYDAARMTNRLAPKIAVPLHFDLFDAYGANPRGYVSHIDRAKTMPLVMERWVKYDTEKLLAAK